MSSQNGQKYSSPDIQGFADRLDLGSSTQSGRRQQSLDKTQGITSQKNNGYINNMFMNTLLQELKCSLKIIAVGQTFHMP